MKISLSNGCCSIKCHFFGTVGRHSVTKGKRERGKDGKGKRGFAQRYACENQVMKKATTRSWESFRPVNRSQLRFNRIVPRYDGARAVKHGGHDTKELLESFNLVATVMVVIS